MDWKRLQDDAERLLRALVRFDTSNPPGNEMPAALFVAGELRDAGLDPVVLESSPGRGNTVARLEGSGASRPLLLFSHLDVVPAEPGHWTHPPFDAEIADGFVWGRGTLDMKHIVAAHLATVRALAREGARLDRDIVFAATADEEAGGTHGMVWLLGNHPGLVDDAEYGLTEFGGFSLEVGGKRFYMCQTGEKGFVWLKLCAEGRPGHGSMPHAGSAITRIAEAIERIGRTVRPLRVCATARKMVEAMAEALPPLAGLLDERTCDAVLGKLPADQAGFFNAILRDTIAVTGLAAGYKHNVIPGHAEASLDCRLVPGRTAQDMIEEIRAIVGEGFTTEVILSSPSTESPLETPLYDSMLRHLRSYDADGIVVPMLLVGGTDGRFLAPRGVTCYGFSPIRLPAQMKFLELVHGHDERIPLAEYRDGVRAFAQTVIDFCSGT